MVVIEQLAKRNATSTPRSARDERCKPLGTSAAPGDCPTRDSFALAFTSSLELPCKPSTAAINLSCTDFGTKYRLLVVEVRHRVVPLRPARL
jgi:hypothetical protein